MGHTQRVTKKDKKGRITSSWMRVRIVVPEGIPASLPPPYTGLKNLTKKVHTDREHAEWTARFLGIIDQAAARSKTLNELTELDSLTATDPALGGWSLPGLPRRAPAVLTSFLRTVNLPVPLTEAEREPVTFELMIPKWAKHTDAPKKGIGDMKTNCRLFADWLEHDDLSQVTFEDGRDWRDEMIEEGGVAFQTISNRLKCVKALSSYVYENGHIKERDNPMALVKSSAGQGEERRLSRNEANWSVDTEPRSVLSQREHI